MQGNFKVVLENNSTINVTQPFIFENTVDKLNRLAKNCEYDDISPYSTTVEWINGTSVTPVFNNRDDAFHLNQVVRASEKLYIVENPIHEIPSDYTGVVGIHRTIVGYRAAYNIETEVDLVRTLTPLVQAAVMDFTNNFGTLGSGYRITMKRPDNSYFKEIENLAGYEFRLTLIKE